MQISLLRPPIPYLSRRVHGLQLLQELLDLRMPLRWQVVPVFAACQIGNAALKLRNFAAVASLEA